MSMQTLLTLHTLRPIATDWDDSGIADAMRRLATSAAHAGDARIRPWMWSGDLHRACAATRFSPIVVAAARVWCGDLLERALVGVASPTARTYFDSYAAAVWTSVHANYLKLVTNPVASGSSSPLRNTSATIHSVHCESSEMSTAFFVQRLMTSVSKTSCTTADGATLYQLLFRCTNPGSRGWRSMLSSALDPVGVRDIVTTAVMISFTGLHSAIEPSGRPSWQSRLAIAERVSSKLFASKQALLTCDVYVKEALRRHVASMLSTMEPTRKALHDVNHTVRRMGYPPRFVPIDAMANASRAMCAGSVRFCEGYETSFHTAIASEFETMQARTSWRVGWVGKGSTTTACAHRAIDVAKAAWQSSFMADFSGLWIANVALLDARLSRVDEILYHTLHENNAVARLAATAPIGEALRAQRLALTTTWSGVGTLQEIVRLLHQEAACKCQRGVFATTRLTTASSEVASRLLDSCGPRVAALVLVFARTAMLSEAVFTVRLPSSTRVLQRAALLRRYRGCSSPPAACLSVCLTCRRIATSVSSVRKTRAKSAKADVSSFTEVGVKTCSLSSSSLDDSKEQHSSRLFCARRPCAIQKIAIEKEECVRKGRMESRLLTSIEEEEDACKTRLYAWLEHGAHAHRAAFHMHRDCQVAFHQPARTELCNQRRLIDVPIEGVAVRIFDNWYALCSYCANPTMLQFGSGTWLGGHICCMRCAEHCTAMPPVCVITASASDDDDETLCRFCGVAATRTRSYAAAGWHMVVAPLDAAGRNERLPPDLRVVHYCRRHYRPWMESAHQVLPTSAILAHLAHDAKPIFVQGRDEHLPQDKNQTTRVKDSRKSKRRRVG